MSRRILLCCPMAFLLGSAGVADAQDWRLHEFTGGESFRYEMAITEDGETQTGHFGLSVDPAEGDRLKLSVDGKLGDTECSGSVTVEAAEAAPHQLMMSCMAMAPVMVALYAPLWPWLIGEREIGDEWSMRHGDESVSFRIEGGCSHAGQSGQLAVMKQNDEVRLQSCVSKSVPLPLAFKMQEEDGDSIEMELVDYQQ